MGQARRLLLPAAFFALYLICFIPFWKAITLGALVGLSVRHLQVRILARFTKRPWRYQASMPYFFFGTLMAIFLFLSWQTVSYLKAVPPGTELASRVSSRLDVFKVKLFELVGQLFGQSDGLKRRLAGFWQNGTDALVNWIVGATQSLVSELPLIFLNLAVFFVVIVLFMLNKHRHWTRQFHLDRLKLQTPFTWAELEVISFNSLGSLLLIGGIQAAVVVTGAQTAGVPGLGWIFLATFIMSFVPVAGAGSVPFVLGISFLLNSEMWGAGVMLITFFVATSIDNVLRAYFFSRLSQVNPFISLLASIGALMLFGLPGLILAPVLEQIAIKVWKETSFIPATPEGAA